MAGRPSFSIICWLSSRAGAGYCKPAIDHWQLVPCMQVLDLVHSENYLHRMTVLSAIGALAPLVNKDVVHNSMLPMVVACCKVGWLAGITSPPVLLLPRSRAATIHSGAVAVCFVCLCVVLCLWLAVFFASPACPPVSCLD